VADPFGISEGVKNLTGSLEASRAEAKAYLNLLKTYSEMALMLLTNKPKKD